MNDPKAKALKKAMTERFEKNSFAKSYKEKNLRSEHHRNLGALASKSEIPKYLRRDAN